MRRSRVAWSAIESVRLVLVALLYITSLAAIGARNSNRLGIGFPGAGWEDSTWWGLLLSVVLLGLLWVFTKRPIALLSRFLGPAVPFKDGLLIVLRHWAVWVAVALLSVPVFIVSGSIKENGRMKSMLSKPPGRTWISHTFPDGRVIKAFLDEARRPQRITVRHPDGTGEVYERSKASTWSREDVIFAGYQHQTHRRRDSWLQPLYAAVFTPAIYEEILFRGLLYLLMLYPLGRIGAGTTTASLFFAAHVREGALDSGGVGLIPIAMSSYLLTSVLLRSKRLTWCIVLHLMFNGTALVLHILLGSFRRYLL